MGICQNYIFWVAEKVKEGLTGVEMKMDKEVSLKLGKPSDNKQPQAEGGRALK